jgi:hypothetical protein
MSAAEEKQAKVQQATEYVVLKRDRANPAVASDHDRWEEVGRSTAVNAQAAIKAVTTGEGTFIAVPARSWKPLTRKIQKVEKDLWS